MLQQGCMTFLLFHGMHMLSLPADNNSNTELPKAEIMSLLKDPSALVKVRDSISKMQSNKQIRNAFHVVSMVATRCVNHFSIMASCLCASNA